MWDDRELLDRLSTAETLLDDLAGRPDAQATAAVQALVDVYGEALERIVRLAAGSEDALVGDPLVAHLLLVHDLHPHRPDVRIRAALAELAPQVRAELSAFEAGVATVRVTAGPAEVAEDAVRAAAPEITEVRVEQPRPSGAARPTQAFVPLTAVRAR